MNTSNFSVLLEQDYRKVKKKVRFHDEVHPDIQNQQNESIEDQRPALELTHEQQIEQVNEPNMLAAKAVNEPLMEAELIVNPEKEGNSENVQKLDTDFLTQDQDMQN